MLGLINDCTEQLVVSKFGLDAWHSIKAAAGCEVKDGGFVKHEPYPDSATVDIVVAAADALGVSVDDVLELFGRYFLEYTRANGYDNLLRCQGSTLRLWLSSLNALHDHLQSSLPAGSFPVFWCEDCDDTRGSILLHYYSTRGALLAQLVVGLVSEIALHYFEVEIAMDRTATQDEEGAQCTTWRISAVDPAQQWRLTGNEADADSTAQKVVDKVMERRRKRRSSGGNTGDEGDSSQSASLLSGNTSSELRCPFTGRGGGNGGGANGGKPGMSRVMSDVSLRSLLSMNTAGTGPTLGTTVSIVAEQQNEEDDQNCGGEGGGDGGGGDGRGGPSSEAAGTAEQRQQQEGSGQCGAAAPPQQQQQCAGRRRIRQGSNGAKVGNGNTTTSKGSGHVRGLTNQLLAAYDLGLSSSKVRQIFPYHVMLDRHFVVLQVGRRLPELLGRDESDIVGRPVMSALRIVKPVLAEWDWGMMQKLSDQIFFLAPVLKEESNNGIGGSKHSGGGAGGGGGRRGSLVSFKSLSDKGVRGAAGNGNATNGEDEPPIHPTVRFKGSVAQISRRKAILVLSPDAANISELSAMGLTMSDLPLHSFQRDSVFLGEHIASEVRSAHKLDKLSKRLEREKELSRTLLHNMLPENVADDLQAGKTVEPCHFENVTLFFSDVVGFTQICDSIEPWDVIDMLNQLYSVMDFLSSHFKLYKVETVGDAYMCCSGLPVPDDRHAENVANYALAVRECVKHVQSPADGTPLQLRIGIHTGHCMGGVVGTLTPHYCLFGDMVNTTARHESTGLPEKIQCSSVLYGRLRHFLSSDEVEQYRFSPRGLVNMKGKGECFTYWLDGGTDANPEASPAAIRKLYDEVGEMLAEEKWKKRRYFRRFTMRDNSSIGDSMIFQQSMADLSSADVTESRGGENSPRESSEDADDGDGNDGATGGSDVVNGSLEGCKNGQGKRDGKLDDESLSLGDIEEAPLPLTCPHVDSVDVDDAEGAHPPPHHRPPCRKETWTEVSWCPDLSDSDLVAHVHELLLEHFHRSLVSLPDNLDLLDGQLYGFVRTIAGLYREGNGYHHWRHACHVVLGASHLVDNASTARSSDCCDVIEPWVSFAAVLSALVHDVKHLGVPNVQLEKEGHVLVQVFDDGSCQERQSCCVSTKIFIEQFPNLSAEVLRGCPNFLHLVTTAVLATDVASGEAQRKMRERFERVVAAEQHCAEGGGDGNGNASGFHHLVSEGERSQSILEHVLLFADVGHCSQDFATFLRWNRMFYEECLTNFRNGRGDDPRPGWFKGQIGFLQGYILPLAERCERLLVGARRSGPEPSSEGGRQRPRPRLVEGTEEVLRRWKEEGEVWTQRTIDEFEGDDRWKWLTSLTTDEEEEPQERRRSSVDKSRIESASDGNALDEGEIVTNGGHMQVRSVELDLESGNFNDEQITEREALSATDAEKRAEAARKRRRVWCVAYLATVLAVAALVIGVVVSSNANANNVDGTSSAAAGEPNDANGTQILWGATAGKDVAMDGGAPSVGMDQYGSAAADAAQASTVFGVGENNIFAQRTNDEKDDG